MNVDCISALKRAFVKLWGPPTCLASFGSLSTQKGLPSKMISAVTIVLDPREVNPTQKRAPSHLGSRGLSLEKPSPKKGPGAVHPWQVLPGIGLEAMEREVRPPKLGGGKGKPRGALLFHLLKHFFFFFFFFIFFLLLVLSHFLFSLVGFECFIFFPGGLSKWKLS